MRGNPIDDLRGLTWSDLPGTVWVLLAANLVPLAGVVAFGWDIGLLLLLYWAESAVILVFSLVKVAMTAGKAAFALIPFFLVHAGMFMGGHLVFLLAIFVDLPDGGLVVWARDLAIGLAVLFASHLVSFLVNVLGKGESYAKGTDAMTGFYGRIVVMHLTIIFGAMLGVVLGFRIGALLLLIALKTTADALAHIRERRKGQPAPADPVGPDEAPAEPS